MWSAREVTVTTVRNFHFRTKKSPQWMILESRQRNKVQFNCTLSFIFNFVVHIFNIATFRNSVALSHIGRLTVISWWPWSVLTRHWRPCDRQFLALVCLPPVEDISKPIPIPRGEKRAKLTEAGLTGKIALNSSWNAVEVQRKVSSIFRSSFFLQDSEILPYEYLR